MASREEGRNSVGRRDRKRLETRARIKAAARQLFLERGYEATTIEDITEAADVSKRTFFSYFPTKEDVVSAWQDEFGDVLAEAVLARPRDEPLFESLEEAMISSIVVSSTPDAIALGQLIYATPALRNRDHLKYAKLEEKLTDALLKRTSAGQGEKLRARLLATVVIGAMRIAGKAWREKQRPGTFAEYMRETLRQTATGLVQIAGELANNDS